MPDARRDFEKRCHAYVPDRRQWPRQSGNSQEVIVWTSENTSQPAVIHDESLTGLALLVDNVSELRIERDVKIVFPERQMWAIVRHISRHEPGWHRVGLEWGRSEDSFLHGGP